MSVAGGGKATGGKRKKQMLSNLGTQLVGSGVEYSSTVPMLRGQGTSEGERGNE
jgi:hypothetical protein